VKRWTLTTVVVAAALFAAGCGGSDDDSTSTSPSTGTGAATQAQSQEPIVIGAAVSESGLGAAFDQPAFAALKMFVDETNANGGVDGRQIKIITADTRSDLNQSRRAAEKVIREGADMVVAPCDYDLGSPAALAAQEAGIVSFSLCSGSPKWGTQGIGPLSYSPSVSAPAEGYTFADYAYSKKGWKTAVQLVDLSLSYNQEVCDGFDRRYTELGGKTLDKLTFPGGGKSASMDGQIAAIKKANPDVIMICTYPPGGPTAMRQIRAAGIDTPALSDTSMDGSYWLKTVPNLSNFYYGAFASIYGDDDRPAVNDFVKKYEEVTGDPPLSSYALNGYVLGQLYTEAVKRAGPGT
jgi:branched-chain amino acid transport system substrate-binding protein